MKKIYYGKAVYDNKEIKAVLNVLKNDSLTLIDGKKVKELERIVSKIFGKKYGLMVNSKLPLMFQQVILHKIVILL